MVAAALGKYGIGLGLLWNAFSSISGEDGAGLSLDSITSVLEGIGFESDFFENGIFASLIDGREGALSLMAGSLAVLPSGPLRNTGMLAGLAWGVASLYRSHQEGKLNTAFDAARGVISPSSPAITQSTALSSEQLAEITAGMERMAIENGAVMQGRSADGGSQDIPAQLGLGQLEPELNIK